MFLRNLLLGALVFTWLSNAFALTPTPAQINQFKSLSKSQQEQLAREYGVDINLLSSDGLSESTKPITQAPILERKTNLLPQQDKSVTSSNLSDEKTIKAFGYDVFKGGHLFFTPVNDLPVPLDYQMEPGDTINVQIFGKTNENLSLKIDREGAINLPSLGPVAVAGQTFEQLRKHVASVIKKKVFGVDVSVSMGTMRTMQVYIVGEAIHPGSYNVNGLTTITQALVASGGVKESGSLRHIQLKRKGKVVSDFDLYDLLLKGDTSKDIRLASGDSLFIPAKKNSVVIEGKVARPAIYELKGRTSLSQLLNLVGGVTPQAYLSSVSLRRVSSTGVEQFTLNLSKSSDRNFILEGGDQVSFSSSSRVLSNAVTIRGEVVRQGAIRFVQGMKISDAIGSIEESLNKNADLNYALLVREINQKHDIEVYQFSLLNALTNLTSKDNMLLHKNDQIFVFDNGLALDYWFKNSAKDKTKKANRAPTGTSNALTGENETIDTETGAVVVKSEETHLNVVDVDDVSDAQRLRQADREALLNPIIERLKQQATYGEPALLIEISGAVKFPGTYPLVKNHNVASVIAAAGGLTEEAYLASAELTRRVSQNDTLSVTHFDFSLADAISQKVPVRIEAQDSLIIKSQPDWQTGMVIDLQGEIKFPGVYTFRRGERIKDVIDRAGGFTQFAYPAGAVFSRERLRRQEAERIKYLNLQLKEEISHMALRRQTSASVSSPSEAMSVVDQLDKVEPVGRLVIDMKKAMKGDEMANLVLEKGDKLFVPALNPIVSIVGEVQYTSNHIFNPNLTVEQYIASAGGTKRQADTDRIYIVKANGSVELPNNSFWFSRNYAPLQPGDTIIVPMDTDYLDGLSALSTATQILYQIGVAWSAIKD